MRDDATHNLYNYIFFPSDQSTQPFEKLFFTPAESSAHFYQRSVSIITAPVEYTVHAALAVMNGLVRIVVLSLTELLKGEFERAGNHFTHGFAFLFRSVLAAILATISPIINAVDLIGGGIATVMQDKAVTI